MKTPERLLGLVCVLAMVAGAAGAVLGAGEPQSTGTAFVVAKEGYLITCAHVVKDAGKVRVAIGGKTYEAAVLGQDEKRDLALLQVPAKDLIALPLANSNAVEVGQEVRALGFPFASLLGDDLKVTKGTIAGVSMREAQKVFQIDAAVNPGNSGGPLVNDKAEVLAVINAKLAGTVVSNVGFAVPINYAKALLGNEGVEFDKEGAKEKLDGPALVKRVSPSLALVSVWPKGGAVAGKPPETPAAPKPPVSPDKVKEMKEAQQAALKALGDKGIKPPEDMVLVPPGEFEMGAADGEADEKPVRKIPLSAFWLDRCEVTNAQFGRFVEAASYRPQGPWKLEPGKDKHPAVNVTWDDAVAYAKWAGKRLPTEAEWEKAARATDGRTYPWGNEVAAERANLEGVADGFAETSPVGVFAAGASVWGALDLAGNAWEWCADGYAAYGSGASALSKVIRGGSFASSPKGARSAKRAALLPTRALNQVGFRCAKDQPGLPAPSAAPAVETRPDWEGAVKFTGETTDLKCTPAFEKVTFKTPLGTLTVAREYVLSVSATELHLLGGSQLKGELQEASLPVTWSLGRRDIPMKEAAYQRVAAPPAVSVGVTKDGALVPPSFGAQVTLADESLLVGDLREKTLRLRVAGVGETDVPIEKVMQVAAEGTRLQVCLTDGNLLTAELLGAYRMSLLEGELTLSSAERLAGMTFSRTGSPGVVSRTISLGGGVTMEFVLIRPGSFMMGSEEGDDQEKPVHKVTITKPFYMGRYEVTQDQWQAVMGTNPSSSKGPKKPVEKITWDECQAYVRKLNEKVPGGQFGLPTEAQWEYACRAGSTTEYCYGQDTGGLVEYAWYSGNSSQSAHPVGEKKPNAWGLYDMHGNVWEWCQDWYAGYASGAQANPNGPNSGSSRVFRGGAFFGHAGLCRSAKRAGDSPGHRDFEVGVRLVRSLP